MPLRVSSANRPYFDNEGFCTGVVKSVTLQEAHMGENGREFGESVRWEFETSGTIRPYTSMYWTGMSIAGPDDKGRLNKLSTLCVALHLVKLEDLDNPDLDVDLEQTVGLAVRYKLMRVGGLYRIDAASITLDETDKPKSKK